MASVTIQLVSVCPGGGHVILNANVNGVDKGNFNVTAEEILAPFPDEDVERFIAALIKLRLIGRTKAQVRADLQAGLTVTV